MRTLDNNLVSNDSPANEPGVDSRFMRLGDMKTGARARIVRIGESAGKIQADTDTEACDMERRFLEMGFEEGSEITLAHAGPVARDPLAVQVNGSLIALRRRDAMRLFVEVVKDRT